MSPTSLWRSRCMRARAGPSPPTPRPSSRRRRPRASRPSPPGGTGGWALGQSAPGAERSGRPGTDDDAPRAAEAASDERPLLLDRTKRCDTTVPDCERNVAQRLLPPVCMAWASAGSGTPSGAIFDARPRRVCRPLPTPRIGGAGIRINCPGGRTGARPQLRTAPKCRSGTHIQHRRHLLGPPPPPIRERLGARSPPQGGLRLRVHVERHGDSHRLDYHGSSSAPRIAALRGARSPSEGRSLRAR